MKHIPGPWELSPSGQFVRKDTKGDGHLVICEVNRNWHTRKETQIANALRIVECVNAMEGIANPKELRYFWDREKSVRQVKDSSIENHLFLSKEELQKLGEQYKNQEETPYIETSQSVRLHAKKQLNETLANLEGSFQDFIFSIDEKVISQFDKYAQDAIKYHNLKEVIQNMIDRLDEGSEMTLTKDSIVVYALKEAIQ